MTLKKKPQRLVTLKSQHVPRARELQDNNGDERANAVAVSANKSALWAAIASKRCCSELQHLVTLTQTPTHTYMYTQRDACARAAGLERGDCSLMT